MMSMMSMSDAVEQNNATLDELRAQRRNGVEAAAALGVVTGGNPPRNVIGPATYTDLMELREFIAFELVGIRAALDNLTAQAEVLTELSEVLAILRKNPLLERMLRT